jgi:hypothetical protein
MGRVETNVDRFHPERHRRVVRGYVFCTVVLPSLTRLAESGSVRYG